MRDMLKTEIPQAFLDDHRTWVDRLVSMARTTVMIGVGVLILVFTAMVLTVVFATRARFPATAILWRFCISSAPKAVSWPGIFRNTS